MTYSDLLGFIVDILIYDSVQLVNMIIMSLAFMVVITNYSWMGLGTNL